MRTQEKPLRIREKAGPDSAACLELLMRVHKTDGYPLHLSAEEVPAYLASGHEAAAWLAEVNSRVVGHVALHCPPWDPTLEVAHVATGLPMRRTDLVDRD